MPSSFRAALTAIAATFLILASARAATLRHHYKLDNGAGDDLGAAALTVKGDSVIFQTSGGASDGYLKLGGSDDYLLASLDTGSTFSLLGDYSTFRPFSISIWVRQTVAQSAADTQAVFGMTTNSTNSATYNTGFEIITREGSAGRGVRVRARQGGGGSNAGEVATGYDICDGNWHHLVAVYEADSRSVYVDGVFRGTNTTPVAITTNPIRYFALGAFLRAGNILDDFSGDLDDLQIYEGAVTQSEATQLFQHPGETITTLPQQNDLAAIDLVDPLVGAADTGYCVPGACLPQSSIYPSPDTLAVSPSGYKAGSNVVGFAQLHAQGAGPSTPSYGNFLVSPRLGAGINESDHASPLYGVIARPYSYRARLTAWNTDCTVVPAANSAIYQFDFPASTDARLSFDVARKLGSTTGMSAGSVAIDTATGTISGGGTFDGNWNPAPYQVYFYAKVDTRPASGGTWLGTTSSDGVLTTSTATRKRLGGWMRFDTTTARTVRLKIAVSFVSVEQARLHLEQEIPAWDITGLEARAKSAWEDALSVLKAPGVPYDEGRKLYTALFHCLVQPRDRSSDAPANWTAGTPFWDDQYTLWDTWQTLYPLLEIVRPAAVASNVNAFAERFARYGRAETAFIQGKDFASGQGGDEVDLVIADARAKQIPGIDWAKVWPLLQFNAGRRTDDYRNRGFVSYDGSIGGYDNRMKSGSSTLAFSYCDWCSAQVGLSLGRTTEASALLARSSNWHNVWDPSATGDGFQGFVRARNSDGTFRPTAATGGSGTDFYQGTCWNYSFNVPHDREAMIGLMGGRARFIERLDFALRKDSGSYVDFANEPSFQTIWGLCHAGRPYLASGYADQLRQRFGAYSLPGDEDSGAMSSLYFFLTAGIFPSAGQDHYYLHGPRVPRLEFKISGDKTFTITAENSGGANIYIQSATLDGQPLDTPVIHHSDILAGRTLAFVMGPHPSDWGTGQDFKSPPARELVIPAKGEWAAGLGNPAISSPGSASPVWENTAGTAIHSPFPQVTLADPGDSITLSADATFLGLPASDVGDRFAWGLFSTISGVNNPGYLATNDTTAAFWKKSTGAYSSAAGASILTTATFPPPAFTDGNYRLVLTLTRTTSGALDYYAALVRASDGVLLSAFTGSDTSPGTFSFDRVGLRLGSPATSVSLRHTSITVRRAGYTSKNLTVPAGSTFFPTDLTASLASLTNFGTVDTITSSVPLPSDFINHGTLLDIHSVRLTCTPVGDDLSFTCPGYSGHTYQLQHDLSKELAGAWENIGDPVIGDGGTLSFIIPGAAAMSPAFFRIKVES